MIFQTEKQLKEFGDKIPADKKSAIESALEELKTAHKSQNVMEIEQKLDALNTVWQAASQDMYQASQSQNASQPGSSSNGNDEKVTDVEFEEVNKN